jgi:hypothetical protein
MRTDHEYTSPVLHILPSRRLGGGYHSKSLRALAIFRTNRIMDAVTPRPGCFICLFTQDGSSLRVARTKYMIPLGRDLIKTSYEVSAVSFNK